MIPNRRQENVCWLRDRLIGAGGAGRRVEVDLSAVTFFGAAGVNAVVKAHHRAKEAGGELVITRASPIVRIVLDVTGLSHTGLVDCQPGINRRFGAGHVRSGTLFGWRTGRAGGRPDPTHHHGAPGPSAILSAGPSSPAPF